MNPRDVGFVRRAEAAFVGREREGEDVVEPGADAHKGAADSFDHSVAPGGGIAFAFVDLRGIFEQFRRSEKDIGKAAAEFSGGALIVHWWVLNIRESGAGKRGKGEQ